MSTAYHRHTYYGGSSTASADQAQKSSTNTKEPSSNGKGNRHSNSHNGRRRQVTFGPYIIGPTLGEGEFGKVKLGWSKSANDQSKNVAIKLIRRDTIPKHSEKEVKIYREINALKHLTHPNIVTLEEVLQNSKYIGIVLQYASGGEFYKYIQKKRRLKEPAACRLFAQLISGVHYMHHKGLAHRDLKLENLLLDEHENLIITDFGFVNEFTAKSDLMNTSCGSPCYAAPELVVTTKQYQARKADVWSCGVILYAMLAGYLPWDDDPENPDGDDIAKLYNYITKTPLSFPEYITPVPRDMLRRILVSNPNKRVTIDHIEKHQWLHPHSLFLSLKPEDWDTKAKAEVSNLFRPPAPQSSQSRYSRPHSNSSISSTEKRNSLIMDSTLHLQPIPPQESQSHAIAKPSSPSSEMRTSPVKKDYHSRSNSAASIALQAVVDAEREYYQTSQNPQQQNSPPTSDAIPIIRTQNTYSASRLAVHNGSAATSTSLMNRNSVIVEVSPNKEVVSSASNMPSMSYSKSREFNPSNSPSRNPVCSPKFNSNSFAMNTSHHANKFGSSHQNRPRPTSYHPISTSYVETHPYSAQSHATPNANEFSYSARSIVMEHHNEGQSNSAINQSSRNQDLPLTSMKTTSFQSGIIRRGSFSASKPSPSIELKNVEGDLIKTDTDDHKNLKQQRRKSQRYSTIISENVIATVNEEIEDNVRTDAPPKETKSLEFSDALSSELGKIALNESRKGDAEMPLNSSGFKKPNNTPKNSISPKAPTNEARPKREKRFSLLSFYSSTSNTSKSSIASETTSGERKASSASQRTNDSSKANAASARHISGSTNYYEQSKPRVASTNSNKAHNRHSMLPPKTAPLVDSTNKRSHHRSSMMVSSMKEAANSNNSTNRTHEHREPSTAKKVFDFFKRRSMRL